MMEVEFVDVGLMEQNIKGVFADLDDGGLTETEALAQIRSIVKPEPRLAQIVLSVKVPGTITVDLEEAKVTEFELDLGSPEISEDNPESRKSGEPIDEDLYGEEITRALAIARDSIDEWPDPERT